MAELPAQGWDFEYLQLEPDRRGQPFFRPVVPVRLEASQLSPVFALVDSGCEHCRAASWLAEEIGIDLTASTDTLELGIGGHTATATFAEVEIHPHRDDTSDGKGTHVPLPVRSCPNHARGCDGLLSRNSNEPGQVHLHKFRTDPSGTHGV